MIKGEDIVRTILKNGKIFIEKGNFQEALLIEDGKIVAFGSNKDSDTYSADSIIDLKGRTVLPGFNDSHLHMMRTGESMNVCDLSHAQSIDEVVSLGKEFLKNHPQTTVLSGRGWNQDYFKEPQKRLLTRYDLDKISTEIPIVFTRACFHLATGNTKALKVLGIDSLTQVEGGTIEIGNDGSPNGIFNENATTLLDSVKDQKSSKDLENDYLKAVDYALSVGITSVQSCDILRNNYDDVFKAIHSIYNNKKTKLRYRHQFNFQRIDEFEAYLNGEYKTGDYDDYFVSRGCLKLFKDGSLGARTAYMINEDHDDPGNRGIEVLSDSQFYELCDLASKNNIQVVTHAIGDAAIESVMDAYEKTMNGKDNPLRHSIIHFQITSAAQLKRAAKLKIPIIYQPVFLNYDLKIVNSRVGFELADSSYAFNSMYHSDSSISFSSDSPIEDCNPFLSIYCAVTRMDFDGNPKQGFNPKEKMSVEDAIDAYTFGSSYNEFKEDTKGKLKPGYVADLIVLDQDIFSVEPTRIKDTQVIMNMIDGEIVYKK
jgi:predicted amidohydrolase YtcJ